MRTDTYFYLICANPYHFYSHPEIRDALKMLLYSHIQVHFLELHFLQFLIMIGSRKGGFNYLFLMKTF